MKKLLWILLAMGCDDGGSGSMDALDLGQDAQVDIGVELDAGEDGGGECLPGQRRECPDGGFADCVDSLWSDCQLLDAGPTPDADVDAQPPQEMEVCNGVDDDQDGLIDEGFAYEPVTFLDHRLSDQAYNHIAGADAASNDEFGVAVQFGPGGGADELVVARFDRDGRLLGRADSVYRPDQRAMAAEILTTEFATWGFQAPWSCDNDCVATRMSLGEAPDLLREEVRLPTPVRHAVRDGMTTWLGLGSWSGDVAQLARWTVGEQPELTHLLSPPENHKLTRPIGIRTSQNHQLWVVGIVGPEGTVETRLFTLTGAELKAHGAIDGLEPVELTGHTTLFRHEERLFMIARSRLVMGEDFNRLFLVELTDLSSPNVHELDFADDVTSAWATIAGGQLQVLRGPWSSGPNVQTLYARYSLDGRQVDGPRPLDMFGDRFTVGRCGNSACFASGQHLGLGQIRVGRLDCPAE
jgi:hypothetical protein